MNFLIPDKMSDNEIIKDLKYKIDFEIFDENGYAIVNIEKVKEKSCKTNMCNNDIVVKTDYQITGNTLDNLLKEMVGEDK